MAQAQEKSVEYPLARTVGAWVLLNEEGKRVSAGTGAPDLIGALTEYDSAITKVFGLNARAILKGASIEALEKGSKAPVWCWYFSPLDTERTRVFDPVDMLTSSFKEKMDAGLALTRIGVPPVGADSCAQDQAEFAKKLATVLGLV